MSSDLPLGCHCPQTLSALLLVPSHPCWPLTFHLMVLSYSWDHSLQPITWSCVCEGPRVSSVLVSFFLLLKRSGGLFTHHPPMVSAAPGAH